jgi:hypothetical protein
MRFVKIIFGLFTIALLVSCAASRGGSKKKCDCPSWSMSQGTSTDVQVITAKK